MLEQYALYVLLLSLTLGVVGIIWLVVLAYKKRKIWAWSFLLVVPALVFIPLYWRKTRWPVLLLVLAALLAAAPYGANYYSEHFMPLGPWEKKVDGELHVTLTGWDGNDYSFLQSKPNTVVLQMANPDVTDSTLVYLKGMSQLRELDLSATQITDEGLAILAELPNLKELRLKGTKITDEGFRKYLATKESLQKLDLRDTNVVGKTKRAWKNAKEGREYL
jgi:hypothetical protein